MEDLGTLSLPLGWCVVQLLQELKAAFNPPQSLPRHFTMSAEQRKKLLFKFLLETERT